MNKKILFSLIVSVFFLVGLTPAQALSFNGLADHVSVGSAAVENLLSVAMSYDSFENADYVIFNDTDNSSYLVWGNLDVNGFVVTGEKVDYIRYYREAGEGFDFTNYYQIGSDDSFLLNSDNRMCVSNLDNFGMTSVSYQEFKFYKDVTGLAVLGVSILFATMLVTLRRS